MQFRINLDFFIVQFAYWALYAAGCSFANPLLLSRGYSTSEIGIFLAMCGITSIIIQSVLADYTDKHPQFSIIRLGIVFSFIIAVAFIPVIVLTTHSLLLTVCYIFYSMLVWGIQPFINNLSFKLSETGNRVYFGICRCGGSVGYSLICNLCGKLNNKYGMKAVLTTAVICSVIFILSYFLAQYDYNRAMKEKSADSVTIAKEKKEKVVPVSYSQFIRNNKMFLVAILGVTIFSFGNSILGNFMLQVVEGVGGTSVDYGNILSLVAFLEIPAFLFYDRLAKRFSYYQIMLFSSFCFAGKLIGFYLGKNVTVYYFSEIFHMLSFPLFLASIIPYVNMIMPKNEANRGQTLYTVSGSCTTIIASVIGGFIFETATPHEALGLAVLCAIIGIVIFNIAIRKVNRRYLERLQSN